MYIRKLKVLAGNSLLILSATKNGLNIIVAKPKKVTSSPEEWLEESGIRVIFKRMGIRGQTRPDLVLKSSSLVKLVRNCFKTGTIPEDMVEDNKIVEDREENYRHEDDDDGEDMTVELTTP